MNFTELSGADLVGLLSLAGGSEIDELLATAGAEDELSGWDEDLAGATDLDQLLAIAGAKHKHKGSKATSLAQRVRATVLANKLAQTQVLARERPANRGGDVILGLGPVTVAGLGTATVNAAPQEAFRPERFVIPSDVAGQFGILTLNVGKFPLFAAAGEAPARTFAENAVGVRLGMYTAMIGNLISVQVRNKSAGPLEFSGSIIGPAIE